MVGSDLSGSILLGRYQLGERIGGGGMAEVYEAEDLQLGRTVAVKLALPYLARDPAFAERLRNEARVVSSLDHPSIVKLYDYGEVDGRPFLVMELVNGVSLRTVLQDEGGLPVGRGQAIADSLLGALEHAHERGVLHRDVKPENVLLARDGQVKLVDFGIARAGAEASVTSPGHVVGSVHYLAPERIFGRPASVSSDVYAVGVLFYQMLTGRLPFDGDTPSAVVAQQQTGSLIPPSAIRRGLPGWLDGVVGKALIPDPADRYSSAAAMREDLRRWSAVVHGEATIEINTEGVNAIAAGGASGQGLERQDRDHEPSKKSVTSGPVRSAVGRRVGPRAVYALLGALTLAVAVLMLGAAERDPGASPGALPAPTSLPAAALSPTAPPTATASPTSTAEPAPTDAPAATVAPAPPAAGVGPQQGPVAGPPRGGPPGLANKESRGNGNGRKKR